MAFTRDELYRHVSHFLSESNLLTPGSSHATAKKIEGIEISAAEFVLALHPWNFASAVKRLALHATHDDADDDSDPIGWKYAYTKGPILRVNWVSPTGKQRDRMTRAGQWDDKGGRILANVSPLYCDGVQASFAQQGAMGYWPRPVGIAIASVIGDWLTGPVTNSRGKQNDMSARSEDLVEKAHTWDAQQAPPPQRREGRWNRGRHRGGARFESGEL
jgi:hypothetical protein